MGERTAGGEGADREGWKHAGRGGQGPHQLDHGALAAAAAADQRDRLAGRDLEVKVVEDGRLLARRVGEGHAAQRDVALDLVGLLARGVMDVDGRDAVHHL